MVAQPLAVLLLTEDTGDDAHAVIAAVVKKVLLLMEPSLDLGRLVFARADERARAAMGFNCYKSRNPRDYDKKLRLAQAVASHLLREDCPTAVFVHIDADRRWSARDPEHLCDSVFCFQQEIVERVRSILAARGAAEKIEHLALLVPFWSVESWLFQNTEEALRICAETHPRHESAVSLFERWRVHPEELDEQKEPKELVSFGAKYNRRLAENGFPAKRLRQLGLSFAHAVERAERSRLRRLVASASREASTAGRT
ncbi:MAG TPA: hypothetical protein VIK91_19590 [Nannocystis sp.]